MYEQYGITFFGGLLDPDDGEQRANLQASTPDGDGDYAPDPFLGPKKPKMPTDEIWIDAARMTLENGARVVERGDKPNLKYAFQVANGGNLVELSTSTGNGQPPDTSNDGVLSYEFSVSRAGPYELYMRSNIEQFDGVNDAYRRVWYRVDGGSWRNPSGSVGTANTTLGWGEVSQDGPIQLSPSGNPHTIEIAAYTSQIDVHADWFLLKHETVAANPFHRGLPHTSRP